MIHIKQRARSLRSGWALFALLAMPSVVMAGSGSLRELIARSLEQHPSVLSQQATTQSSAAGVEVARWQFYPTPSISVEDVNASKRDISYQGDERVTTLRLQQPLWSGGKLTAGVEKSESALLQAQASEKEVRRQLAVRVVQAYSEWLSSHLRLQVAQRSYETHRKLGAQVRRRAELGASAESDQSLVAVRMDAITGEIAMLRGQMNSARVRLAQLLGTGVSDQELVALSATSYLIRESEAELCQLAVTNNPAVARVRAAERVSAAAVSERQSDLMPQVYLRVERQFGNFSIPHSDPSTRYFVGVASSVGAGLSNRAAISAAVSQQQAAQAEIEMQERAAQEEVLTDHAQLAMLQERVTAIKSSIAAAAQIVDSYLRQFLAGRKTWTDVMNAVREDAQYQSQGAELEANKLFLTWRLAINSYGLETVLGGEGQ